MIEISFVTSEQGKFFCGALRRAFCGAEPPRKKPRKRNWAVQLCQCNFLPYQCNCIFPAGIAPDAKVTQVARSDVVLKRSDAARPRASIPCQSKQFLLQLGLWFLVCYAVTQLAIQLQQERIQVVRRNKVVRRLPTESNSTPQLGGGNSCQMFVCIVVCECTVASREIEITVFDPASQFLSNVSRQA